MRKGETVFTYVVDDGRIPIQKLSLMDQIRVLLKRLAYDQSSELKSADILTKELLKLKGNLVDFIQKATDPIRKGDKQRVTFSLSSRFNPVLDEVLQSDRYSKYYDIQIERPVLEYDVEHFVKVKMKVKKD